jgi:predicted secreted hydrolase
MKMNRLIILYISLLLCIVTLEACDNTSNKDSFPTIAVKPNAATIGSTPAGSVDGAKIDFPQDEAPHNAITEWWYYTGHLKLSTGRVYGFEYAVFQSSASNLVLGYAAHFAITNAGDNLNNNLLSYELGNDSSIGFDYDQRSQVVSQPFTFGGTSGFNLNIADWSLQGLDGSDHIKAKMTNGKYAVDLALQDKQGPVLQAGGEISYGAAGASFYYSRPFMLVSGTLTINGRLEQVTGQAWFDHQWGNFIPNTIGQGWDWFNVQLNDGTALMFYRLRGFDGKIIQVYGSYILPCLKDCSPSKPLKRVDLDATDLSIKPTQVWDSQKDGVSYPIGWKISLYQNTKKGLPNMTLMYKAAIPNQVLDTTATTYNKYWEGESVVTGIKDGKNISGLGYVELTGSVAIAK